MFAAFYRAHGGGLAGPGAAPCGSRTDRSAPSLLFPRNVFTPTDERSEQRGVVAELQRAGVLDGRIAVAAEGRFENSAAAHRWAGVRLSAGLVAGWKEHRLRFVSERCDGIVATRFKFRKITKIDERRRGECGAAVVARRKAHRFCFDRVQQAISCFSRGCERR